MGRDSVQTTLDDFQDEESSARPIPRPPTKLLVALVCVLSAVVFGASVIDLLSAVAVGIFVDAVGSSLE